MYYRNANCVMIVFDVCDAQSLYRAKLWVKEIRAKSQQQIALVANKIDMQKERFEVKLEDANLYAEEHKIIFMQMSAKSGQGVSEGFQQLAELFVTGNQVLNSPAPIQIVVHPKKNACT
uniref:Rab-like protein n=1 Tax=Trepomonas sp. PC1 TaxID=1076344 RepID=A0A146K9N7_9EUKA|eukprot:JAP92211.1 Rab-like protein [Trepomonas sp. PC1]